MKARPRLTLYLAVMAYFVLGSAAAQTRAPNPQHDSSTTVASQTVLSDSASPAPVQSAVGAPAHRAISFRRDGLWLSTSDGGTHLQVHGYVQADNRLFFSNVHGEDLDAFLFRRIRPLFEGTLFNNVDFRFMPDFGQSNPQIQEAYLELKTLPYAKLRVGKFKEPIGLEVLRQDRDLTFTERSIASDLVPLRYFGAQLSGAVLGKSITYEGGYFNGSSDGSNGVFTQWAHGNEGAARIFFQPFSTTKISTLKNIGFGVGGSSGSQSGTIAGLKTPAQTTFFKYSSTAVANGPHNRISPQAYYYAGPFFAMAEYIISSQEVLSKGKSARIENHSWEIQGSVMLTGDKNSYSGFRPRDTFEPNRGFRHMGAVELAFRYGRVGIDPNAFSGFASSTAAQQADAAGIGLNWHLNRYVKLMTDFEHTTFKMGSTKSTPLSNENCLTSRLQLAF